MRTFSQVFSMISWIFTCTSGNPRWGSKVISRRGGYGTGRTSRERGDGRGKCRRRGRGPLRRGTGEPKSEPPGEQTCQVWGMVGPAEPLRQQEGKSGRECVPGQKEQRPGKLGQGGQDAAVRSTLGSEGTQTRLDEQIRESLT